MSTGTVQTGAVQTGTVQPDPQAKIDPVSQQPTAVQWLIVSLIVSAALAVAILTWKNYLEDRLVVKRFGVVEPGQIYRSGQISKWLIEPTLLKHDIGCIVNLNARSDTDPHQKAETEAAEKHGIEMIRLPLRGDGTGEISRYADAIEKMVRSQQAGIPVLVHCSAGADRTGGVCFAFRTLIQGWSAEKAQNEMYAYDWRNKKSNPLPEYYNSHVEELAGMLLVRGLINKLPDPMPKLKPAE